MIFIIPPWNLVFNNSQILSIIISRILWWWIFRSLHIPAPETFSISESGTSQVFGSLTFYQLKWGKNCLVYLNWSGFWTSWWFVQVFSRRTLFLPRPVFLILLFWPTLKSKAYCLLTINSWCIFVIFIYIFSDCIDIPVVT